MTIVSFTGSATKLTEKEKRIVKRHVYGIKSQPSAFFSGAAPNVDIWAAACAIKAWPESRHVVIVPMYVPAPGKSVLTCKHDAEGVARLEATAEKYGAEFEVEMSGRFAGHGDEAAGLLRRDDVLAVSCTHMMAFPKKPKELTRSGTWATIRRGRKLQRKIMIVPLSTGVAVLDRG